MTITRCPACGMATVTVADHHTPPRCEHCGQPLDAEDPPTRSSSEALEVRVRERLYGRRGLGRRRPLRR